MQESEALPPLARSRPTIWQRFRARWRKDLLFFAIAVGVVVVDQFTKAWVRNNLRDRRGGAGVGAGHRSSTS